MSNKNSKVVIVGDGNVGSTTAYTLINQGLCDELVLIDRNEEKVIGDVLDMTHAIHFMNRNMKIIKGDYSDCKDADIIIITASAPMDKNAKDRTSLLAPSKAIVKSIITSIMDSGFSGIILMVANPVDIMTYYAYKLSKLPANKVIGSGTTLDSARLDCEIASRFDIDSKSVDSYVIGEHGASEMIAWSSSSISGRNAKELLINKYNDENITKEVKEKNILAGFEILRRKGNTSYGIAASVASIVKAILFNENRILPVSTLVNTTYGDVYISLPCVLNSDGVRNIMELNLTENEKEEFKKSVESIYSYYQYLD